MNNYTIGSLFAGIGGIEQGFKNCGFKIEWANEIDKNAAITYKLNHNNLLYNCDIKKLPKNLLKVDIITAGFPCQPFSIAGKKLGFNDTRGNLFFDILNIIDYINPKIIFLENVKGLINHDNKNTFKVILNELQKRKYFIKYKILNSFEYGNVPQNRERIYIICFKNKIQYKNFKFPEKVKLTKTIKNILEKVEVEDKFYYFNNRYYEMLKKEITKKNTIYQFRRTYVRMNKSNLCPTLTANMGTGGHNVPLILDNIGIRKLTPRECARFQGFNDNFIFDKIAISHIYKQIGNSVTVPVIENIAKQINLI